MRSVSEGVGFMDENKGIYRIVRVFSENGRELEDILKDILKEKIANEAYVY